MRILTRYILKEVVTHAALGAVIFTFVIFMRDVGRILELIVRNSAPLPSVAELFFLTLPSAFTITLPMAVLVGILIGLSRMAADSEITAMRASGIGSGAIVAMVSLFAVSAWILALVNNVYLAPRSEAALVQLQESLKSSQVSYAVQPRVFYENFPDMVLYVQDVESTGNAAVWKNVFMAEVRNPASPKITIAEKATVIDDRHTLNLHLTAGAQHESVPRRPSEYNISTYNESDVPIRVPVADPAQVREPPAKELTTRELLRQADGSDPVKTRWFLTEFHRRLALPTACLVLALVGISLGMSSRKGGKSSGFVLMIFLVFFYYLFLLTGIKLAREGTLPAWLAVWMANFIFAAAGVALLIKVNRSTIDVVSPGDLWDRWTSRWRSSWTRGEERRAPERALRAGAGLRFPLLLDSYVLRTFLFWTMLVLAAFVLLTLVFTFFELLGDIVRNRVPLITVGDYLLHVTPSMIYTMTPLSVLIAVLVTFSGMQSSNELTAMKATGISLYRVAAPVLLAAFLLSLGLFYFEQMYLPAANTRQESIRNAIKGKPAQTFFRPDQKWIFGQQNVIYYYEHFDPDGNGFAGVSAFRFDPESFTITQRVFAARAQWEPALQKWVLQNGWTRSFDRDFVTDYRTFDVATFDFFAEPPSYFKKEVRLSSEMDYGELSRYIRDLQQSGFDVVRLRVQLYKKIAYPLIIFVMAVLAVPFSLRAGRRGALAGVAIALGIAILYWVTNGLFEAMGNVSQLPALLAAFAPTLLFGLAGGYLLFKVQT